MTNEVDSAGSEVGGAIVFGAALVAGKLAVGRGADDAVSVEGVTLAVEPEPERLLDEPHPASATAVRPATTRWRLCMHVPTSHRFDARENSTAPAAILPVSFGIPFHLK
jgi:hypothetical protein